MGKPWIRVLERKMSVWWRTRKNVFFPRPLPVSKTDVKSVQTHKKMNTNKSEQQLGNHSWKRSGLFRCGLLSGTLPVDWPYSYSLGINSLRLPPSHPQLRKNVNRPDNIKQSYVLSYECLIIEPDLSYLCVCCPLGVKIPITLCEMKKLLFHQITSNIYM